MVQFFASQWKKILKKCFCLQNKTYFILLFIMLTYRAYRVDKTTFKNKFNNMESVFWKFKTDGHRKWTRGRLWTDDKITA